MFTDDDYRAYFNELESIFRKTLVIYTDLLNEIGDQSIRNKLFAIAAESMDAFRFVREEKEVVTGRGIKFTREKIPKYQIG